MKKQYISPEISEIPAMEEQYLFLGISTLFPDETESDSFEKNSDAITDTDFD